MIHGGGTYLCPLCFEDAADCRYFPTLEEVEAPAPEAPPTVPSTGFDLTISDPEAAEQADVRSGAPTAVEPLRSPSTPAAKKVREHRAVRFARDVLHLDLFPRQQELLVAAVESSARLLLFIAGRQSGKSLLSAVIVLYEATANRKAHLAGRRAGERPVVALVANSAEQARVLHRTIRQLIEDADDIVAERVTSDLIALSSGIDIVVMPASGRTIRGRAVCVAVIDELAHAVDGTGQALSPQDAKALVDSIVPATATFEHGRVIITSSPKWASGTLYELAEQAADPLYPSVVAWTLATPEVRPDIPASFFEAEQRRDLAYYSREYLARWDSGIGALFDRQSVEQCIGPRAGMGPVPGMTYAMTIDPALGGKTAGDRFVVLVGHRDPKDRSLIVDLARSWQARPGRPLDQGRVLDEVAGVAKAYNNARVRTDQWAAQFILAGLRERGVSATAENWTNESKLEAVGQLRQRIYAAEIELPRDPELIGELLNLEQRPTPSGRPRIAAPPGMHDDYATALLALVADIEARGTFEVRSFPHPLN